MQAIPPVDVQEVTRPVVQYGHLVDARDWEGMAAIFTGEATIEWVNDQGSIKLSITEVLSRLAVYDHPSAHHATNVLTDVTDQDTVRVTSKGLAIEPDGRSWSVTYTDLVTRTPAGWRIAQRVVQEHPSQAREERARARQQQPWPPARPIEERHNGR
ncbi:nuclear transport factor 2 family protein [Streptomyces sp. NPDC001156]